MSAALVVDRGRVARCLVECGRHAVMDGCFYLLFEFPNGLSASVVQGPSTVGYQVGVMDGDWLVEVVDGLEGGAVLGVLVEIMERTVV